MKHGKNICKTLRAIRLDIARANGIEYVPVECHHEGECAGTCPACESEVRYLEREIARKRSLGKAALVAGVSLGLTGFAVTSCDNVSHTIRSIVHPEPLAGEVVAESFEQDSLRAEQYTLQSDKRQVDGVPKAVFPGGEGALFQFIKEHFVCPELEDSNIVSIVEVFIDAEGSVQESYVPYMTDSAFCAEALRVTRLLSKFEPAQDDEGNAIESTYYLLFDAKRLSSAH